MSFKPPVQLQAENRSLEAESIDAQLVTSSAARQRLLQSIDEGVEHYIMASRDGQLSVPVRIAIGASSRGRELFADGALIVDWSRGGIEHGNNRVSLTQTELRLLSGLLEANGQLVSRSRLIACAWPRSDPRTRENSLAVYICGLRKRLASIGLPDALQTVRREGYRLRFQGKEGAWVPESESSGAHVLTGE